MFNKLLFVAAFVATLSVSAAQAQDATSNPSASQTYGSAAPSGDTSGYGGAAGKSASGAMTKASAAPQQVCVGPASYCDIYKGGQ
ncbi:hypothetical protein AWB78_00691 [Caballeronia calidae]|uniref:Lipoprotein n=1 Tax=Caballeronia calidae TaxID=1777139 RepID=A0A157ZKZ6_9BURK|nr:hypothetical protein [Caballeronia calidae]SAK46192.1 hypothetical protein AWB78_00691 [Caballeronia calidae]